MPEIRKQLLGKILRPGQRPENVHLDLNERPVLTDAERAAGIGWVDGNYEPGDVRRYGAVGDGVTDDTTALQTVATLARSAPGLTIKFEAGKTYSIWSSGGTGTALFDLDGATGITVEGNGATLSAGNMNSGKSYVFLIETAEDFTCRNLKYTQSYTTLDDTNGGVFFYIIQDSHRIHLENIEQTYGLAGIFAEGWRAGQDPESDQISAINCTFTSVYYPQLLAFSGSNYFARNIKTIGCGRGYFAYNVRNHDVDMYSEQAGTFDDVMLKVYAYSGQYSKIENMRLRYVSDGKYASGSNSGTQQSLLVIEIQQGNTTSAAAEVSNVDINFRVDCTSSPIMRKFFTMRRYDDQGSADTTTRTHLFRNIRLSGVVTNWNNATEECIEIFPQEFSESWSGDQAHNIRLCDLFLDGGSTQTGVSINGQPFADGDGVILENVRSDMDFTRTNWTEQIAFQAVNCRFDNFTASKAYISYSPAWTSSGTAPSIGNGTLDGFYTRTGDRIKGYVNLVMGSTTTYGTGAYSLSLPATSANGEGVHLGSAYLLDSGTAHYSGVSYINPNASTASIYTHAGSTAVGASVPFTFAQNDIIRIEFDYIVTP